MKRPVLISLICWLLALPVMAMDRPLTGGIPATLPKLKVNAEHQVEGTLIDVQFLPCFYQALDQSVLWKSYPTARLIQQVHNNKLDMIFPMGFTSERKAHLIQSAAVQVTRDYWVYTHALPDLQDKSLTVGVKLGSPQASYVQTQDYENIVFHNNYAGLLKMLLAGRVELIALPDLVYDALTSQYSEKPIYFKIYLQRDYGFYLKPNTKPFQVQRINQAIMACRK